jgi:hypothetical protein
LYLLQHALERLADACKLPYDRDIFFQKSQQDVHVQRLRQAEEPHHRKLQKKVLQINLL